MSPDDIFASQMWPWPDPALKRDTMGRVLFVNAAFLQMYGGTIDDWRGNAVTGWPAPQAPGIPYKFETRLPTADGEQVYDWMEFTLADGTAFAMARNVTYLCQSPDPNPGTEAHPPMQEAYAQQTQDPAQAPAADVPVAVDAPYDPTFAQAEPEIAEAVMQSEPSAMPQDAAPQIFQEQIQEQIHEPLQEPAYAPDPIMEAAQSVEIPDVAPVQDFQMPEFEQVMAEITETPPVSADPVTQAPTMSAAAAIGAAATAATAAIAVPTIAASETVSEPVKEQTREYERRALPIENDDAVLGNNWRDAVIAKAVGVEFEAEKPAAEEEPAQASSSDEAPVRILLAEDNAINALLTRTLLEAEGHIVDTVEDGQLAVEAMKTTSYDLIFMDMRMPNMDGLEATRKIRGMSNVPRSLPIVALTANAFDDDRNACFDSGMNDFMTKPVSAEELSEMVRTWTKNLAERRAA